MQVFVGTIGATMLYVKGKDPVDPVIRPHPMFLQKNMFRFIEWFISLLT